MQRIGFFTGVLSERGTEVAIFDYAFFNQQLLNNTSVVFVQLSDRHEPAVLRRFKDNFSVIFYSDDEDFKRKAATAKLDAIYFLKSGERTGTWVPDVRNLIHAVFPQPLSEVHGDVYAFISEWLSKEYSNHKLPFVPHIITLPSHDKHLRSELGIPSDAVVFGCYGGSTSFDLEFVRRVVTEVSSTGGRIYFIFMNIPPFCDNANVRFLPRNIDLDYKVAFINTCDAMLHARSIGESFGLACGEFSVRNKPVLTYGKCPQRSQIDILGAKGLLYDEAQSLRKLLQEFDPVWSKSQHWDCYSELFSPLAVMKRFEQVFLMPGNEAPHLTYEISMRDKLAIKGWYLRRKVRHHSKKWAK